MAAILRTSIGPYPYNLIGFKDVMNLSGSTDALKLKCRDKSDYDLRSPFEETGSYHSCYSHPFTTLEGWTHRTHEVCKVLGRK